MSLLELLLVPRYDGPYACPMGTPNFTLFGGVELTLGQSSFFPSLAPFLPAQVARLRVEDTSSGPILSCTSQSMSSLVWVRCGEGGREGEWQPVDFLTTRALRPGAALCLQQGRMEFTVVAFGPNQAAFVMGQSVAQTQRMMEAGVPLLQAAELASPAAPAAPLEVPPPAPPAAAAAPAAAAPDPPLASPVPQVGLVVPLDASVLGRFAKSAVQSKEHRRLSTASQLALSGSRQAELGPAACADGYVGAGAAADGAACAPAPAVSMFPYYSSSQVDVETATSGGPSAGAAPPAAAAAAAHPPKQVSPSQPLSQSVFRNFVDGMQASENSETSNFFRRSSEGGGGSRIKRPSRGAAGGASSAQQRGRNSSGGGGGDGALAVVLVVTSEEKSGAKAAGENVRKKKVTTLLDDSSDEEDVLEVLDEREGADAGVKAGVRARGGGRLLQRRQQQIPPKSGPFALWKAVARRTR